MKRQSWIIVIFMIFGVFLSVDRSNTIVANGSPPTAIPQPIFQPAGNTSVSLNLNTGEAEVTGTGDVSINIEQPEQIKTSVETRTEYITVVKYKEDIVKSTKLINKLDPLRKPVHPVWRD